MKNFYRKIVKEVFLSLLVVCLSLVGMATTYYVSNSGLDTNSGLTTALPWKTINKVNSTALQPGDNILFKRGDVWRESMLLGYSGNSTNRIVYSSYGTGNNPRILCSQKPTTWTLYSTNIWKTDANFVNNPYNVGATAGANVWSVNSNGSVNTGIYKTSLGALTADNNWYYASNIIYLYSTSDPSTRYTSVEAAQRGAGISMNHKQYIEINGIDILYGNVGIYESTYPTSVDVKGLIVRNCELAYFGYAVANGHGIYAFYSNSLIEKNIIHDCGRKGIGLTIVTSTFNIKNVVIQNNAFYHGYYTTSVDLQAASGYTGGVDSLSVINNLIYEEYNYAPSFYPTQMYLSDMGATNSMTNILVYNNIFKYASGASMSITGIEGMNIYNNTFYGHNEVRGLQSTFLSVSGSHIKVKDNIFYSQLSYDTNANGLAYVVGATTDYSIIESDYNCFYRTTPALKIIKNASAGTLYATSDSTYIRTTIGWDAHSKFKDPLLQSSDLSLQSNSPCIQTGFYTGPNPNVGAY